ncbi:hypothetical protein WJX74_010681 [Apatococcus lobatus]|uniref:Uncharacterized protein n=1 Tax=Apatococcus lobatus TaxID=904363 RepID=A0AAW1QKL9_9CHLO
MATWGQGRMQPFQARPRTVVAGPDMRRPPSRTGTPPLSSFMPAENLIIDFDDDEDAVPLPAQPGTAITSQRAPSGPLRPAQLPAGPFHAPAKPAAPAAPTIPSAPTALPGPSSRALKGTATVASTLSEAEQLRAKIAAMQAVIDRQQRQQQQPVAAPPTAAATSAAAGMRPPSRSAGFRPPPAPPARTSALSAGASSAGLAVGKALPGQALQASRSARLPNPSVPLPGPFILPLPQASGSVGHVSAAEAADAFFQSLQAHLPAQPSTAGQIASFAVGSSQLDAPNQPPKLALSPSRLGHHASSQAGSAPLQKPPATSQPSSLPALRTSLPQSSPLSEGGESASAAPPSSAADLASPKAMLADSTAPTSTGEAVAADAGQASTPRSDAGARCPETRAAGRAKAGGLQQKTDQGIKDSASESPNSRLNAHKELQARLARAKLLQEERRRRQEAATAAKEREAEIRRHLQRLTEEPPGLSSAPEMILLQPQQMSLLQDAPSSHGVLAAPSVVAAGPQAASVDHEAAEMDIDVDQPNGTAGDAMDTIQLHDPEIEKQLQQLLEGSRAAEHGADAAMRDELDEEEEEEPGARRQGSSPISPAGSRALLKSQLWEQQARKRQERWKDKMRSRQQVDPPKQAGKSPSDVQQQQPSGAVRVTLHHNQAATNDSFGRILHDHHTGRMVNNQDRAGAPVTGQELALVDDEMTGQDDELEIMSAEEGERQRAQLADRFLAVQAGKAAIKAQRKAMDEMFQAMKRTYSELNSEQAELESALGSITARSLRSQPPPPAAMLSAMRSLPGLGLLTGPLELAESAEDRQAELDARAAARSEQLLQQLRQLEDPGRPSAAAALPATSADLMPQLGKRKRTEAQLQEEPSAQLNAAAVEPLPFAKPAEPSPLQPQSQQLASPQLTSPLRAVATSQRQLQLESNAPHAVAQQGAAGKPPGSNQPVDGMPTDPAAFSAKPALPSELPSARSSASRPDHDTWQPAGALAQSINVPQPGKSAPAMRHEASDKELMIKAKLVQPESVSLLQDSAAPSSKQSLQPKQSLPEAVPSTAGNALTAGNHQKPTAAQTKAALQEKHPSFKPVLSQSEPAHAASPGSASSTTPSGSGMSSGPATSSSSQSRSNSSSTSASDSDSRPGSSPSSGSPSRRGRSTSDTSSPIAGYPHRSAQLLSRRSQLSRDQSRPEPGQSAPARRKEVSARADGLHRSLVTSTSQGRARHSDRATDKERERNSVRQRSAGRSRTPVKSATTSRSRRHSPSPSAAARNRSPSHDRRHPRGAARGDFRRRPSVSPTIRRRVDSRDREKATRKRARSRSHSSQKPAEKDTQQEHNHGMAPGRRSGGVRASTRRSPSRSPVDAKADRKATGPDAPATSKPSASPGAGQSLPAHSNKRGGTSRAGSAAPVHHDRRSSSVPQGAHSQGNQPSASAKQANTATPPAEAHLESKLPAAKAPRQARANTPSSQRDRTDVGVTRGATSPAGATSTAPHAAETGLPDQAASPAPAAKPRGSSSQRAQPDPERSQQPHKGRDISGGPAQDSRRSALDAQARPSAQPSHETSAAHNVDDRHSRDLGKGSGAVVVGDKAPAGRPGTSSNPSMAAGRDAEAAALPARTNVAAGGDSAVGDKAPVTGLSTSSRPQSAAPPLLSRDVPEPSPMESGQLQPESQTATPHTLPKLEPSVPGTSSGIPCVSFPDTLPPLPPGSKNGSLSQDLGASVAGQMQPFPPGFPPVPSSSPPFSRPTRMEGGWIRPVLPVSSQDGWIRPPGPVQRPLSRSWASASPMQLPPSTATLDGSASLTHPSCAAGLVLPRSDRNLPPSASWQLHANGLAAASGSSVPPGARWNPSELNTPAAMPISSAHTYEATLAPSSGCNAAMEPHAPPDKPHPGTNSVSSGQPPQQQQLNLSIAGMTKPNLQDLRRRAMQNLQDIPESRGGPSHASTHQNELSTRVTPASASGGSSAGGTAGVSLGGQDVKKMDASDSTRASSEGVMQSSQGVGDQPPAPGGQAQHQLAGEAESPMGKPRAGAAASEAAAVVTSPSLLVTKLESPANKHQSGRTQENQASASNLVAGKGKKTWLGSRGQAAPGRMQIVISSNPQQDAASDAPAFPAPAFLGLHRHLGSMSSADVSSMLEVWPVSNSKGQAAKTWTPDSTYVSPLSRFRSYRLCESYRAATGAPFLSATYGNNIDAQWPLCPYEARGSCRNAKCPYQMTSDYTLEAVHVVRDIFITAQRAGSQAAVPSKADAQKAGSPENLADQLVQQAPRQISLSAGSQRASRGPAKPRQVPAHTKRELCMEGKPSQYTLHPGMPPQPLRCFASHLLQPIVADPLLPWGLMPGWSFHGPLPGSHASITSQLAAEASHAYEPAIRPTQSGMENRYFSGVGAAVKNERAEETAMPMTRAGAKAARLAHLEARQGTHPFDPEPWMLHALELIDFNSQELSKDGQSSQVLKVLARGLEKNQTSAALWLLYLHCYSTRLGPAGGVKIGRMAVQALEFQPGCYRLWQLATKLAQDANELALLLMRGIIAWAPRGLSFNSKQQGDSGVQSKVAVDLVLRLWALWSSTGEAAKIQDWVACLIRDADAPPPLRPPLAQLGVPLWKADASVLPGAARQALLDAVKAGGAACQAMLWLTSAHLAAWGHLPDPVVHRLGFEPRPFVLEWSQLPPASTNATVRDALRAAIAAILPLAADQADASSMEAMLAVAQSAMLWNAVAPPAVQVPGEAPAAIMRSICSVKNPRTTAPSLATRFLVWRSAASLLHSSNPAVQPAASTTDTQLPARPTRASSKRSRLAEESSGADAKKARISSGEAAQEGFDGPAEMLKVQPHATISADAAETVAQTKALIGKWQGRNEGSLQGRDVVASGLPPSALHALMTAALGNPAGQPELLRSSGLEQATVSQERAIALCPAALSSHSVPLSSQPTLAGDSAEQLSGRPRADLTSGSHERRRRRRRFQYTDPQAETGSEQDDGPQSLPDSGVESGYSSAASDSCRGHAELLRSTSKVAASIEHGRSSVRAAFLEHLQPRRTSQDAEEGELPDEVQAGWTEAECAFGWLNLAIWDSLCGNVGTALSDCEKAAAAASGHPQVEQIVWQEKVSLAAEVLLNYPGSCGHEASGASQGADLVRSREQRFTLLRHELHAYLQWAAMRERLRPLELESFTVEDTRLQCSFQELPGTDSSGVVETLRHLTSFLSPSELVALAGDVAAVGPMSPAVAVWLLDVAGQQPANAQRTAWALPLAVGALHSSIPPPAPSAWLKAVLLAERHSLEAAQEICTAGIRHWPWGQLPAKLLSLTNKTAAGANKGAASR